ncbi:TPR-domain containing protein [Chitinispirillum alkaliphilum]|nr:TPR-domain containing protein [Chitinispirillum alkaliphilum]
MLLAVLVLSFSVYARSDYDWQQRDALVRRFGSQWDKINLIDEELGAISDMLVDLRYFQLFPARVTGFDDELMVRVDRMISFAEGQNQQLNTRTEALKPPLVEAVGIMREMIVSGPADGMFDFFEQESRMRIEKMLGILKEIDRVWEDIDRVIAIVDNVSGVMKYERKESVSEVEEFLDILRSGLGQRSGRVSEKLEAIKDEIVRHSSSADQDFMFNIEIRRVRKFLSEEKNELAYERLMLMMNRYRDSQQLAELKRLILEAQFSTGRYADAVASIEKQGIDEHKISMKIQSLFALGRYNELWREGTDLDMSDFRGAERNLLIWLTIEGGIASGAESNLYSELAAMVARNHPYALHVMHALGRSYLLSGDASMARNVMESALRFRPSGEKDREAARNIRISIAEMDYEMGHYDRALEEYFALLKGDQNIDRILYGVAWCYIGKGMNESAERTLRKLLNLYPQSAYAAEGAYVLSKHYIQKAQREWQRVLFVDREERRIANLVNELEERKQNRLTPEESKRLTRSINQMQNLLENLQEEQRGDHKWISSLYRRAEGVQQFINRHYHTGTFHESDFSDKREIMLHRADSLFLAVIGEDAENGAVQIHHSRRNRQRIRDVVNRTLVLQVEMRLLRYNWELEYLDWRKSVLGYQQQLSSIQDPDHEQSHATSETFSFQIDSLIQLEEKHKVTAYSNLTSQINDFLNSFSLRPEDEAYFRYHLGELYYSRETERYLREYEEYETDLIEYMEQISLFNDGKDMIKPRRPAAPEINHSLSISEFRKVLALHASEETAASASYSLAWCFSDLSQPDSALFYMKNVAQNFPRSVHAPQAWMYAGEHYFDTGRLENALRKYQAVLKYPQSEWFDQALYKLAWTQYRLSNPDKAISSFLALLELGDGRGAAAMLERESVDYIAISFSETDITGQRGFERAMAFVERLQDKERGFQVLHRLASVYREQGRYQLSQKTYAALLQTYPEYRKSPFVESEYLALRERDLPVYQSAELKFEYFKRYNRNGEWASLQQDLDLIGRADSAAARHLYDAAIAMHQFALQNSSVEVYESAMEAYDEYVRAYPDSPRANECHYNYAEILFSLGEYERAAQEYMAVSRRYPDSKYRETAAWNAIVASQNLLRQEAEAAR